MVSSRVDQVRSLMDNPANIRNVSVIAHIGHGKSTVTNALVERAGLANADSVLPPAVYLDGRQHSVTTESVAISLPVHINVEEIPDDVDGSEKHNFLINLIDCPGHVDFSSEVTAALRITDGALVVVDAIEGVCGHTERVIRLAVGERNKPILFINKVDRAIHEFQLGKEDLYQDFCRIIDSVNSVIDTGLDNTLGDIKMCPETGTVAFGSSQYGWAFTVRQFASMYSKKFGIDMAKLTERLWGDHLFNPETKTWTKTDQESSPERGFNQFCLDPIFRLFEAVTNSRKDAITTLLEKLSIRLDGDEKELEGLQLLKVILRKFLPAAEAILEMTVLHLPSPKTAQKYRMQTIYEGPADDEAAVAIQECNEKGPLMLFISKMVPTSVNGRLFAFGRVFAGTARSGSKVRIQGPRYIPGKKDDLFLASIQHTLLITGQRTESVESVPAGNLVGLIGVDQFLLKSGTVTTLETAYNLKAMKLSVSPIIQCSVEVRDIDDLPKLVEGLKLLSKIDPCILATISESGEHIIAGAGQLHLGVCLRDLEESYAGVPLRIATPVIQYRETVSSSSQFTALAKSPNKYTRLFMTAQPLGKEVSEDIEAGKISARDDHRARAQVLADTHGWDLGEARKIWCFGPDTIGPNLLVDQTRGVIHLSEIKDAVVSGFHWATKEGPIVEEPLHGVRCNLVDATLFADAIHRGGGQVIPATRRVVYASTLLAEPALLEPIFLTEIHAPEQAMDDIYDVLSRRRVQILNEVQHSGRRLRTITAHLPVKESFGFSAEICAATSGQAFSQSSFDHWQVLLGSPLDKTTLPGKVAEEVRKRKGLIPEVPSYENYCDKL